MKVLYGISLPPNLTAPTRGELVVRIESFVLQEGLLAESGLASHPAVTGATDMSTSNSGGVTVDDSTAAAVDTGDALKTFLEQRCCISPQFWGEPKPTVHAFPPSPSAPTDADGTARSAVTAKYPIKTLPAQLEQYFRHMTLSSMGGLPVHLLIPGASLGKKKDAVIATATIAMTALTPTTPLSGWFTLTTTHNSGGGVDETTNGAPVAIGRVKLTITATFFNSSRADEKGGGGAKSSKVAGAVSPPRHEVTGNSSDTNTAPAHHGLNVSTKSTPLSQDAPFQPPHRTTPPPPVAPSKPVLIPPSYRLAAEHEASLSAARQQQSSISTHYSNGGGQHRNQPPSSRNSNIFRDADEKEFQSKFQQLIQRGERLRDNIAHAADQKGDAAIEQSLAARAQQQRRSAQHQQRNPSTTSGYGRNITGLEHRFLSQHAGVVLPGDARYAHDDIIPSDEDLSSETDHDHHHHGQHHIMEAHHAAGGMYERGRRRSNGEQLDVSPSRIYDRATCLVEVMLQSFCFSEPVEEIRVQIRTSPDVMCANPFDALSSFVHFVGKDGGSSAVRIPLSFEATSFSSDSKVVIECFAVKSKPIVLTKQFGRKSIPSSGSNNPNDRVLLTERLLGVVFLGLYSASSRVVKFHDPLTGTNPVECLAEVRVHQVEGTTSHNTSSTDVGGGGASEGVTLNRLIPAPLRHSQQRKRRDVDGASSQQQTTEWNPSGYNFAQGSYDQLQVSDKKSTERNDRRSKPGKELRDSKSKHHNRKRHHRKSGRHGRHNKRGRSDSTTSTTSFTSTLSTESSSRRSISSASSRSSDGSSISDDKELIIPIPLLTDPNVNDDDDDDAARFREENKRRFELLRDGAGSPLSSLPHSPNSSYAAGSGGKPPMPLSPSQILSQRPPPSPTSQPQRRPGSPHQRPQLVPPAAYSSSGSTGAITIPVKVSRLHVSIKGAKSLPNVRCGGRAGVSSGGGDDVSLMQMIGDGSRPNSPTNSSAIQFHSSPNYTSPSSFCVVEDLVYEDSPASGATFPAATTSRSGAPTASSVMEGSGDNGFGPCTVFREFLQRLEDKEKMATEDFKSRHVGGAAPPSHWAVEAAVRGHYDRTLVVAESNKPVYNYECSLGVTLPYAQRANTRPPHALNAAYNPNATRDAHQDDPLRHLQGILISVWHSQPPALSSPSPPPLGVQQGGSPKIVNAGNPSSSSNNHQSNVNAERQFWERACRLGTCFVDLRPMKYFPTVDGWFRVYSDSNSVDTTIGFVHVAVRKV